MPSIDGDSVLNSQLATRMPLSLADRKALANAQAHVRWAQFLQPDAHELIVLATTVIKRKGIFSAKRRQLILIAGLECHRICYVDPSSLELKGTIPWSSHLHAEVAIKGNFMIHIPGRTYYLEDANGDQGTAERWVQTISTLQMRQAEQRGAEEPKSPMPAGKLHLMDSFRSVDDEPSVRRGSQADPTSGHGDVPAELS